MKRSKKTLRVLAILFGVVGTFLTLIYGLIGLKYLNIYLNRVQTSAIITEVNNDKGYTLVSYTTEVESYQRKLHMIDSEWDVGEYITIIYDKRSPEDSFIKNQATTALLLCIVGSIFLVIALVCILMLLSYSKKKKKLLEMGKRIEANIVKISKNNAIHFKGKNPYKIELSYKEGNKKYTFIHNELWFDVEKVIEDNKLETIEVIVDEDNYDNYYINLGKYKDENKCVKKRK